MNNEIFKFINENLANNAKRINYVLNATSSKNETLTVILEEELCELDGGVTIFQTFNKKNIPEEFKYNEFLLNFNIIFVTPSTKEIGKKLKERYNADLVMLY